MHKDQKKLTAEEYKKKKLKLNPSEKVLLAQIERESQDGKHTFVDSAKAGMSATRIRALAVKGFITCRRQANSTLYKCRALAPGEEISFEDRFYIQYTKKSEAIKDAAQATYILNRFCKNKRLCSYETKEEIYQLKGQMVNYLYEKGLCIESYRQKIKMPNCDICKDRPAFKKDKKCNSCGRKGGLNDQFYVFRFKVGNKTYQWHQPIDLFPHEVTVTKELAPMNKLKSKDIYLKPKEVEEKLALVKWLLQLG